MKLNGFCVFLSMLVSFSFCAHADVLVCRLDEDEIDDGSVAPFEEMTPSRDIASEPSPTAKKMSKKELFYKCGKGNEVRWMRLYYLKNGKCKTVYSKEGDAKEVSTAYSYETCENVLNNIKKNLENGGYTCEEKILMGSLELE